MASGDEVVGPFNLVNTDEVTMVELAQLVIEFTGSPSRLDLHPLPANDPVRRRPDLTLTRERLGWAPVTELTTGMARTIDYFRGLLGPAARDV